MKDPSYILSGANKILYEQNKPREYPIHGTAFLGLFFNDGKVVYSNAGHEIPFLISSDKGVAALSASPQIALGIIVDPYYKSYETQLNSGDILILYTDGLTDARSHDNQMDFYDSRIIADLREIRENMNGNFKSFSKTLLQKSLGFSDRKVPKDDTIVIAIQKS
ncbi:MAG: serine/threonine-protein phosphatase [Candidatus Aenigmarchaeota archaeon]|nr:serine/threonine-protein phosphatase [Candidatus Aenigmarchaeota archaeon]